MIEIIDNSVVFWEQIRILRNHPIVKKGFINQEDILPEFHREYMEVHGGDYIVALWNNAFAGFAGCVNGDIRVALHPEYQGKGIARKLIAEIVKRYPDGVAKVKIGNIPSVELFNDCGFHVKYFLMERS